MECNREADGIGLPSDAKGLPMLEPRGATSTVAAVRG